MNVKILNLLNSFKKAYQDAYKGILGPGVKWLETLGFSHSPEKLENSVKQELMAIACSIATLDNVVTRDEVFFINTIFDKNYSVEQIFEISTQPVVKNSFKGDSATIKMGTALDNALKQFGQNLPNGTYIAELFMQILEFLWGISLMFDTSGKQGIDMFIAAREKEYDYIFANNKAIPYRLKPEIDAMTIVGWQKEYQNTLQINTDEKPIVSESKNGESEIRSFEIIMQELNDLVGLDNIKTDVKQLINLVKVQKTRQEKGLKAVPMSLHLVFTGNPGTGKTTVARLLAELYKEIGVLKKGQLIEVDRSELVAGYVGQTAIKTQEKIDEALGGILFIDEAYTLVKEGNDYGQEAIDTLLKEMEDKRDEFIVIVAGYEEPMKKFIDSNPGLKSRFNKFFHFLNYTNAELNEIFDRLCSQYEYIIEADAKMAIEEDINQLRCSAGDNFANGREVRNYFENLITKQANRIVQIGEPSETDVMTITIEDVLAKN